MDISCKSQILFLLSLHFLLINNIVEVNMKSSKIYYLTKKCKSLNDNSEYASKLQLNINVSGAFIKSHNDYLSDSVENDGYPDNFLCEIVAEASVGYVIMLLIESLYIPAQNSLCDENYLYVFDYKSSRSKAMTSAGGEKGLCGRVFPTFPIFTTGPYITIVFKSNLRDSQVPHDAGFQLTLTQVQQTDKNNGCRSGQYHCSPINLSVVSNQDNYNAEFQRQDQLGKSNLFSSVTMARLNIPQPSTTSIINYCIPLSLLCDGVRNCHDGSDEDGNAKKLCSDSTDKGKTIINRFLSLGLSASITIAVSCTIVVVLCIGITVCYCTKLCTSLYQPRQSNFTKVVTVGSDNLQTDAYPPIVNGNHLESYSYVTNQSSQFVCVKDGSVPSLSFESEKIYCIYPEPQPHGYSNMSAMSHPASDKIGQWTSSSLASYPSTSEGHHSHPETPFFKRKTTSGECGSHNSETKYRSSNKRGQTNSYPHYTPTSSRSAKSTRSTKSSNIDKKSTHKKGSNTKNHSHSKRVRKYPVDNSRIMVLGPVLGEV